MSPPGTLAGRQDPTTSGQDDAHLALVEENDLLRRYGESRDTSLRDELVHRFMPLARSLALRYRGGGESMDDLIQVANLGLVKALERYRPDAGSAFPAYAAPTILGELRRHFRDRAWDVRLPRGLHDRALEVNHAIREITEEAGRSPTVDEIAERANLTHEDILEVLQAEEARRTLSLDAPPVGDGTMRPAMEMIESREMGYGAVEDRMAALRAGLDEREIEILELRFEQDLTQYEIGERLGISQMQVSRIMRRALRKLLAAVRGEI
jgi:RNA polymerase sigma-B factor